MAERMREYGQSDIDDTDEVVESDGLELVDDIEAKLTYLSDFDQGTVNEIVKLAKANFTKNPGWEPLLKEVLEILNDNDKDEDEDSLSGSLQDKLGEANGLVVH